MEGFFIAWAVVAAALLSVLYLYSKMTFFKTLYSSSILEVQELKEMIEEDRVIIELYEFDIAKHLNSIDYLQKEIVEAQTYLKEVRNKNTRLRNEAAINTEKIRQMKIKLDTLF